jgi:hypothetical protein
MREPASIKKFRQPTIPRPTTLIEHPDLNASPMSNVSHQPAGMVKDRPQEVRGAAVSCEIRITSLKLESRQLSVHTVAMPTRTFSSNSPPSRIVALLARRPLSKAEMKFIEFDGQKKKTTCNCGGTSPVDHGCQAC